jgi:hypothetical protein
VGICSSGSRLSAWTNKNVNGGVRLAAGACSLKKDARPSSTQAMYLYSVSFGNGSGSGGSGDETTSRVPLNGQASPSRSAFRDDERRGSVARSNHVVAVLLHHDAILDVGVLGERSRSKARAKRRERKEEHDKHKDQRHALQAKDLVLKLHLLQHDLVDLLVGQVAAVIGIHITHGLLRGIEFAVAVNVVHLGNCRESGESLVVGRQSVRMLASSALAHAVLGGLEGRILVHVAFRSRHLEAELVELVFVLVPCGRVENIFYERMLCEMNRDLVGLGLEGMAIKFLRLICLTYELPVRVLP